MLVYQTIIILWDATLPKCQWQRECFRLGSPIGTDGPCSQIHELHPRTARLIGLPMCLEKKHGISEVVKDVIETNKHGQNTLGCLEPKLKININHEERTSVSTIATSTVSLLLDFFQQHGNYGGNSTPIGKLGPSMIRAVVREVKVSVWSSWIYIYIYT